VRNLAECESPERPLSPVQDQLHRLIGTEKNELWPDRDIMKDSYSCLRTMSKDCLAGKLSPVLHNRDRINHRIPIYLPLSIDAETALRQDKRSGVMNPVQEESKVNIRWHTLARCGRLVSLSNTVSFQTTQCCQRHMLLSAA